MSKSPVVIPWTTTAGELSVEDSVTLTGGARGLILVGVNGTTTHFVNVDTTGRVITVGAGTAGTPTGGVFSIQGVSGGQAVPISGTVTTSSASTSANNAAAPSSSTQIGGSDGTNLQAVRVFDSDSGAGTQYVLGAILRKAASGGSVEAGTATDPLRVDPTGTTTQPVSGTVTANIGTSGSLALDATLTGNNQRTRITDGTSLAAVKAASTAAVAADPALVVSISPNNTVAVTQSGSWTATVTQATAANLNATVVGAGTAGTPVGGVVSIQGVSGGQAVPISGSVTASNASIGATGAAVPASATQVGGSDGTNLQAPRVFDTDSGAGTQYVLGAVLRKVASGGSVEAGTSTDPLRVDPTGTTTQPVSGTVTANQGTAAALSGRWPVTHTDGTNSMPTGDAAARGIFHRITDGTNSAAVKAASTAAVAADPALVVAISPNNTVAATQSGTWTVAQGTAAALSGRWPVIVTDGTNTMPSGDAAARGIFHRITDGTNSAAVKAASTAAVGADPALVVAVSPNNSVAVTQATAANLNAQVQGAGASGAAVTGNPVLVAGSDGTNARTIRTLTDGSVQTRYKELATFTGVATGIAIGNNKSMISLVNTTGSAVVARLLAIYVVNVQTASVTGVAGTFEIRRFVSHAAGTAITAIETMDTADTLDSSLTVRTNATITSESTNLLWRTLFSTDEWGPGGADVESYDHTLQSAFPIWNKPAADGKPIILRANQGVHVKFTTNSTAGTFDLMFVFTQE